MAVDNDRVEQVFSAAVGKASPAERGAYLDGACGNDRDLRDRVEALLACHDAADGFMQRPLGLDGTATAELAALRLTEGPGTVIGRYKLLQLIGEGGFGSVFMAQQDRPVRRTVALKVIKLGMDTKQVIARFEAERQALAMMDHPNIARVLDAGATESGRPYFVMELVRGVPITEYCDANNLSTRERLELFVPVCHAVQHAHQKGVIHRDIKPSNILVTMADGRPIPKVIDFGIAKATSHRLTEQTLFTEYRQLVGTPEYMSPEQAEMSGIDVDTRTDVYSLGVLLYELLTGTTPFDAKELRSKAYDEIQRLIREVEPPRPSTRVSALGPTLAAVAAHRRTEPRKLGQLMRGELDWVVMKAMEKDRTRRYETANGLAMDVKRYLDNEPVSARPASASYRLRKLAAKHKAGIAAGAAVVASLALGLAGTTAGLLHARAERDRAVSLRHAAERARDDAAEAAMFIRDFTVRTESRPALARRARDTAARLDRGWLRDQPDTAAICRTVLGIQMIVGGLADEGGRQLEAALALHRGPDGRYSPAAAVSLQWMGEFQRLKNNDLAAAERWYRQALDATARSPGERPEDTFQVLHGLIAALEGQGKADEVQRLRVDKAKAQVEALALDIATDPTDITLYRARTTARYFLGDARGAAADLGKRAELDPDDSETAYAHCAMALYAGDEEGYRRARRAMLLRFSDTNTPEDGERAAKAHLASPDVGVPLEQLTSLVDRALKTGPLRFRPWFEMTKAMAEYRAGRFESAISRCERAREIDNASAQATLDVLTAMCHARLGNAAEAYRWLERAEHAEGRKAPTLPEGDHYALYQVLLKEAKALVRRPT